MRIRVAGIVLFLALLAWHPGVAQTFQFNGLGENDYFGYSVAIIDDLDRDGFYDLAVGAPEMRELFVQSPNSDDPNEGYVLVYSGRDGHLLDITMGTLEGNRFGWSVIGINDLDDDHLGEYVVGAPNIGLAPGYIQIVTASESFTLLGYQPNDRFGFSLANSGDLNGDQIDDIAVGAPGANNNDGAIYVFSGIDRSLLVTLQATNSEGLGHRVVNAGDINHDNFPDLLAGSWNEKIYGYFGNGVGFDSTPVEISIGAFIASVESVGDLNGDGFDDVAVSSETDSSIFLFLGGASGLSTTPVVLGPPSTLNTDQFYLGYTLSGARDLDCDGKPEIVVGVPLSESGKVHAFTYDSAQGRFSLNTMIDTLTGNGGGQFGFSVSAAYMGGLDYFSYVIVGEPMTGTGRTELHRYQCNENPPSSPTPTPTPTPTPNPNPTPTPTSPDSGVTPSGTPRESAGVVNLAGSSIGGCSHSQGTENPNDLALILLLFVPIALLFRCFLNGESRTIELLVGNNTIGRQKFIGDHNF